MVPRHRKEQRRRFPAFVPKQSIICPWPIVKAIPKIYKKKQRQCQAVLLL